METMTQPAVSAAQLNTIDYDEARPFVLDDDAPVHPLAGIDDDLAADLATVGVTLTLGVEREVGPSQREAMAALLLRRAGGIERAVATLDAACDLELAAIRAHYGRKTAALLAQRDRLVGYVQVIAEVTEWKKKKSVETPYGTFGVKDTAPTVRCEDDAALLAWAQEQRPEVVRVTAALSLSEARQFLTDEEIAGHKTAVEWGKLKATLEPDGALPPGVVKVEGSRTAFAKPAALQTAEA